jgi:hypothetical protein
MAADPLPFIHPSKRYRLFFDETGNADLDGAEKSPNERYLSLTGVVIRQDIHDGYLTRRLNRLKNDIFGRSSIILHRRDIMRRDGDFAVLRNEHTKAEFDARLAAIIAEIPTPAFTVSIDKLAHKQKYKVWRFHPYHYCMTCLLERYVRWLERTGNVGDVTGEARDAAPNMLLGNSYARFYKHGTTVKPEMIQSRLTTNKLKLEPKTSNVAGLQLADVLAHPAHRTYKFQKLKEPLPNDYGVFLSKILERRIYDRYLDSGRIEGVGRKWLP